MRTLIALALTLAACQATEQSSATEASANPVRKVVTMLQMMQQEVKAEGVKEASLMEKFECYCHNGGTDLSASIAAADTKAVQLESDIKSAESEKAKLQEELKQHKADRDAAKAAMAEATELREKEAAAFEKASGDGNANINALKKAIAAIAKGTGGFLQTSTTQVLLHLVSSNQDLPEGDRRQLTSFLSGSQAAGYAPQSGEVVGILKQLLDDMSGDLASVTATEEAAIKAYTALMAAKKKEVEVLQAAIEDKMERVAKLGVEVAEMKNDLEDTQGGAAEDKKFLENLDKACADKAAEWEERKKTRAQELLALAETITVLNDDDALDLFKKTLPNSGSSFTQLQTRGAAVAAHALQILRRAPRVDHRGARPELDFIALALQGKKMNFDKVIKMIDALVVTLANEQKDDDGKKAYCGAQFDETDDQKKALERTLSGVTAAIAEGEEGLATVKDEITALENGIKELDKDVAEATQQRKEEHVDFTELMASDTAAKKLLEFAKNRLQKFYNPALYKPPPARELTEAERITVNHGGEVPEAAAGGIAGTGITVLAQKDAPPPPPETFGAYTKKSGKNTGVIAMIDLLIQDLDKDMTEATTEEGHAQTTYEELMQDSAAKRKQDSQTLADKQVAKANLEQQLADNADAKASTESELKNTLKVIAALHAECDWLLQYFDVRKEARANEVQQLKDAKAVLSGADYS